MNPQKDKRVICRKPTDITSPQVLFSSLVGLPLVEVRSTADMACFHFGRQYKTYHVCVGAFVLHIAGSWVLSGPGTHVKGNGLTTARKSGFIDRIAGNDRVFVRSALIGTCAISIVLSRGWRIRVVRGGEHELCRLITRTSLLESSHLVVDRDGFTLV